MNVSTFGFIMDLFILTIAGCFAVGTVVATLLGLLFLYGYLSDQQRR